LCDAVTGQEDGQATLEMLDRANLFIVPLDDERRWYRYHHLFADLLRTRLRLEHAEKFPILYHRAADWFEKNDYYVEAIDHFLSAGEFQRAADLVKLGTSIIFRQQRSTQYFNHTSMLRWLEALPGEFVQHDPRLSILYTQSAWALGWRDRTIETHSRSAQQAYERLVAAGEMTSNDPEFLMLPFDIYVGRAKAAIYTGDFRLSVELAEKALAIDIGDNPPALAEAYRVLHWAYRESGHLDRAKNACDRMISVSQPQGYHNGILEGLLGLGFTFQMQGHLQRSADSYQQVLQYAEARDLMWMRQVPIT
jgi:LuxR family maltose regulon positive regulatory protein